MNKKKAVLVSCFDWYDERLKYIEKFLKYKGYEVILLTSDFNHINKKIDKHLCESGNQVHVNYIHVPAYKKNISIKRLWSHYFFAKKTSEALIKLSPNLVYCLLPPNSLAKTVSKLKDIIGFKLVFDVIDLWPESFPKGNSRLWPFIEWRKIRDTSLPKADRVVVECDYYRNTISQIIGDERISTFYLVREPMEDYKAPERITLCYLGSINSLIDIEGVCNAIRIIKKIKPVRVKVIGDGEQREAFLSAMRREGAEVAFYGKIYDSVRKQEIFSDGAFGLNLYKDALKIGLSIKSVDYFQMGLPILNSVQGDTKRLVEEYGAGINIDRLTLEYAREYIDDIERHRVDVKRLFDDVFSMEALESKLGFLDVVVNQE